MSHLKFLYLLFVMFYLIGCKPGTVEKVEVKETEVKDTTSLSTASPVPATPVYVSTDSGYTWKPFDIMLPAQSMANQIEQLGDELVISTEGHGIFISQNHRTSWKDISTGLATKDINTIYVHDDELYICLSHEGVTRWKLGSPYWESFNNNLTNRNLLAIVKYKDELIIGSGLGIFKSSRRIQTWTGKHFGEKVVSLVAHGDTILAGTSKGVLISIDAGEKWKYTHTLGPVYALTILGKYVYAQYTSGDLYVNESGTRSWRKLEYGSKDHSPVLAIMKAGEHYLLSTRHGLFFSKNGKTGWKLLAQGEHLVFKDYAMQDGVIYGVVSRQ